MPLDPKSMPYVVNRFGSTTLFDDISPTSDVITVVDGTSLPPGDMGGNIQISDEIIVFESRVGDTLYGCRRGLDGTEAVEHFRGEIVTGKVVALNFNSIKDGLLQLEQEVDGAQVSLTLTLTAQMIEAGQLSLDDVPSSADTVQLIPAGGPMQFLGIDYSLVGNIIGWDGLGLDGVLEEGDILQVYYKK